MARPRKKGLDYFPLDTDIFEDDKLFDVQNDYGPLGEVIYIRLLCLVYKNGYYYQFESLDKLAAMMTRSIGNRWTKDKKTVKDVILYLAKINLFSAELMQRNVITSRSIQERYQLAVGRRQSQIVKYNLLEKNNFEEGLLIAPENSVSVTETPVNVTETPVNVSNNATKESKVKESKEKESKVNEIKENEIKENEIKENESRVNENRENENRVNESRVNESRINENNFLERKFNETQISLPSTTSLYGEFHHIRLTDSEFQKLTEKYGTSNVENYIKKMDVYLENSGRSYNNCYLKLQQWLDADNVKKVLYDGFDPDKYKCLINQF